MLIAWNKGMSQSKWNHTLQEQHVEKKRMAPFLYALCTVYTAQSHSHANMPRLSH